MASVAILKKTRGAVGIEGVEKSVRENIFHPTYLPYVSTYATRRKGVDKGVCPVPPGGGANFVRRGARRTEISYFPARGPARVLEGRNVEMSKLHFCSSAGVPNR